MTTTSIRVPTGDDVDRIKQIAVDADMFDADDVGFFDGMLSGFFDGSHDEHRWLVAQDERGVVLGAAHYAPEPFADRLWNLYFLAVAPESQDLGIGGSLLRHVEAELRERGTDVARVLVIETSSTDQYARTRSFYGRHGYAEEARIRQFYGPADDKVVFWKSLSVATA